MLVTRKVAGHDENAHMPNSIERFPAVNQSSSQRHSSPSLTPAGFVRVRASFSSFYGRLSAADIQVGGVGLRPFQLLRWELLQFPMQSQLFPLSRLHNAAAARGEERSEKK